MDEATDIGTLPEKLTLHDFGAVAFAGGASALFERHLRFDAVVDPAAAHERQRFEALARSVRDILSQRWIKTLRTYDQKNPQARLLFFFLLW
jgi:starch phosphorylase